MTDAAEFYTVRHPDEYHADWRGFYAAALRAREQVLARWRHEVDVPYGPDPAQVLDVLYPDGPPRVALLFFHGGRWREGAPAFYDHFGAPWLERGVAFVSAGYRKEPAATIADAVADASTVLARTRERFPGVRLVVGGHSAGAHLSAMLALTGDTTVDGAILMSGIYDLSGFADDEALSPIRNLHHRDVPTVVSYGDPEPNRKADDDRFLTEQGRRLAAEIDCVEVALPSTDHVGTAAALVDPDGVLFAAAERVILS